MNSDCDSKDLFYQACKDGSPTALLSLLLNPTFSNGIDDNEMDMRFCNGLRGACEGGHFNLAIYILLRNTKLKKNKNIWQWGFRGACEGRRSDMAQFMITYAVKHAPYDGEDFMDEIREYTCWELLIDRFANEKRFVVKILLRLDKERRNIFIDFVRDNPSWWILNYLQNRHLIVAGARDSVQKTTMYNILEKFICKDMAFWSLRFNSY